MGVHKLIINLKEDKEGVGKKKDKSLFMSDKPSSRFLNYHLLLSPDFGLIETNSGQRKMVPLLFPGHHFLIGLRAKP